ncbi:GNAT family N-acetyltransferase [Umboniibacter marinipuniceus]|uniref:Acetyltransferase (GNAT) family protein n=1 Tax=Umboniibacter marinipuniceus TaxID=569599 RepID=A0A3M0ADW7_9GAMM|nr:GNAT family N-acetyltransferase [Umboniibacter marinipuniceus]RMA80958.1 acetyltransferase (GNAT) family protein [Umboniibacter marinipuniceus]
MQNEVVLIQDEEDITLCFDAFKALRPHLNKQDFIEQVARQAKDSYQIVAIKKDGVVPSAAGFRITEFLAWGKVLYIDDLTTCEEYRGNGYASTLMDWLINHAKENGCEALHLDTGHHRHVAHKLYLKKGLSITSHHLSIGGLQNA